MYIRQSGRRFAAYAYDPATQRNKYVGTFDGRLEAKQEARRREEELSRRKRGPLTVRDYHRVWFGLHPRNKKSSEVNLRDRLKPFLRDFGDRLLDGGVSAAEARAWSFGAELPDGTRFEKAHVWAAPGIRAFYNNAIEDGYCSVNPFSALNLPKARRVVSVITEEELRSLVGLAEQLHGPTFGTMMGSIIQFAAYSGIRPGEIFALCPEDVDLETRRINVNRQWNTKIAEFTEPKHGPRKIVLFPEAAEALERLPLRAPNTTCFVNKSGGHLRQPSLHGYWDVVRRAFGTPEMDFYELKHFCGTPMAEKGFSSFDIAIQLGHNDNGRTAERHYIQLDRERALRRIETQWNR